MDLESVYKMYNETAQRTIPTREYDPPSAQIRPSLRKEAKTESTSPTKEDLPVRRDPLNPFNPPQFIGETKSRKECNSIIKI